MANKGMTQDAWGKNIVRRDRESLLMYIQSLEMFKLFIEAHKPSRWGKLMQRIKEGS